VNENGDPQEITWAAAANRIESWSPDGKTMGWASGFVSLDGKAAFTDIANIKDAWITDFSPDGRWFAYAAPTGSRREIWVRSLPDGRLAHQISVNGGLEARWCLCGELFYRNGYRWFSAKISTTPNLHWDSPQLVFETEFLDTPGISYDISTDGQRLLVVKPAEPAVQDKIQILNNWSNF
jgi:hypothetical protein